MDAESPPSPNPPAPLRKSPSVTKAVLKLLAATAVIGVALFLGGRPLLDAWRERQIEGWISKVSAHLDAGRMQEGSEALREALRLFPSEPAVLRLVMQSLPALGGDPSQALLFQRQLIQSGKATTADRAEMARMLLATGGREEAQAMLNAFSPADRATPEVIELESDLLRAEGRATQADALLRQALQLRPEHPESRLRLAIMDSSSPFREVQEEAFGRLWGIARNPGPTSLRAIGILAGQERLTAAQTDELLALIERQNGSRARPVRYQVLNAFLRAHPDQKETWIEKEVSACAGRPPEECLDLWQWLGAMGEHERILKMLPQDRAVRLPSLFATYAEALAGLQRWGDVRRLLRFSSGLALSPDYLSLLQARCTIGLKEPSTQIRSELEEACRKALATRDWRALQRAAAFASSAGQPDVAAAALQDAARLPQLRLPALEMLLDMQTQQRATEGLLSAVREIQAAKPGERGHLEHLLYLKLLVGLEVEAVIEELPTLVTEARITPETGRFLGALAALRLSDVALLRERLASIDGRKLPVGQRATYAGMLRASGQIAEAFAVAEKITRSLLLPEEERLLLRAL